MCSSSVCLGCISEPQEVINIKSLVVDNNIIYFYGPRIEIFILLEWNIRSSALRQFRGQMQAYG